jgi:hypothetical protein
VDTKEIIFGSRRIAYTLKRSYRARSLRVSVYPGGKCVVTAPVGMDPQRIDRFLQSKEKWIVTKVDYFKDEPVPTLLQGTRRDFLKNKEAARRLVRERLAHWNAAYRFKVGGIAIRNQKTRWGSCSKKGNLNFNHKIVCLPSHLADYLIVHELCHIGEFNHSKKFWDLVAQAIPDYKKLRRELRKVR